MTNRRVMGMLVMCVVVLSVACGKKAPTTAATAPAPPVVGAAPPVPPRPASLTPTAGAVTTLTEDELFARKSLDQLNAEQPLSDVWFEFDQWTIRDDARMTLQRNADWLRRWPSTHIAVEGHCDDRGTGEYNLGLGERRANAVKEYLTSLGVAPERVLIVSKGEETPMCVDASEECWRQNRRGHPIITAK